MGVAERDGRIYIPYYDARGRRVWWRIRTFPAPGDTRSTWSNPRGERVRLYNVSDTQKEVVWICEGETDTMTMLSYIVQSSSPWGAVGVPGADTFRESWKWLLSNAEVRVCFDGDDKGRTEGRKLARLLRETSPEVHFVPVPDGEDLNSLWRGGRIREVL